jgi:uncharacterized integral membrane protein (TIGR00698 family)
MQKEVGMAVSTQVRYPAELVRKDDWLSVWIAFIIMAVFVCGVTIKLPDWKWLGQAGFASRTPAWIARVDDLAQKAQLQNDTSFAGNAALLSQALTNGDRRAVAARAAALKDSATAAGQKDYAASAAVLADQIRLDAGRTLGRLLGAVNLALVIPVFLGLLILTGIASVLLGKSLKRFLGSFVLLFVLTIVVFIIAGNTLISYYGLEYVFWALVLGLLISNTIGTPSWLKEAVNTELYVKTGLVLLGAELIFRTILTAGVFGLLQAVVVIVAVWYFCYWLAGRLGVDKEFAAILSTGVSVCGVSAAIAAGGALKGDPKKVSHTISLVLIVALPMLVFEPIIARALHLGDAVAGAWLGGTIDTTGAVVAAGTVAGKKALDTAVIVKFSQNALIGVIAFLLSIWASLRRKEAGAVAKPSEIWDRFPKFVLGFIAASVIFSVVLSPATATRATAITSAARSYLFALAFLSIGLETKLKDLVAMEHGRPALAFVGAQLFNILWTLLIAFLLFSGLIFPVNF